MELCPDVLEAALPESVEVVCLGVPALIMQACVPAATGRGLVAIGFGWASRGSEGCVGGIVRQISSRKVYIPSLATKLSFGYEIRFGASTDMV